MELKKILKNGFFVLILITALGACKKKTTEEPLNKDVPGFHPPEWIQGSWTNCDPFTAGSERYTFTDDNVVLTLISGNHTQDYDFGEYVETYDSIVEIIDNTQYEFRIYYLNNTTPDVYSFHLIARDTIQEMARTNVHPKYSRD